MSRKIFLHGGGDKPESRQETFGLFAAETQKVPSGKLALVIAEEEETAVQESWQAYSGVFTAVGVPEEKLVPLSVSPINPLTFKMVAQAKPSGLFVCGGMTPTYHQAIGVETSWTDYLQEIDIPYGGTSAGAAIAASQAILGGWQAARDGQVREILFMGAGEGIDSLTVRPSLGLVPFAVDVHASQMGTLTRLIHAVESGLVAEGWAIDENTMLVVDGRTLHIHGQGHCYHVQHNREDAVAITIHVSPEKIVVKA
jgi:cyanophycinase